jgi:formamidopyrimidine-DNA glycosylase
VPELPDIELYLACLRQKVQGKSFSSFRLCNPFALRTVTPRPQDLIGVPIVKIWRIGKRVAFEFESGSCMVIHLMVSGRFRWGGTAGTVQRKISHAVWVFDDGSLTLTEASSRKRAGIWLFPSVEGALSQEPGGIDPLMCSLEEFKEALTRDNKTLKRGLTNPRRFSGIGSAYSDEILHAARLSPLKLTQGLSEEEIDRLFKAVRSTLDSWRIKLLKEFDEGAKFPGPGQVTAFRPDFATHGKFGKPCPVCEKPIQRIVYAENETNYCAVCQNNGQIYADRSLSRLLKDDWPRSFAEEEG